MALSASLVSSPDAAFMAFGKGDGTVEHPQLGEVRATCVLCQAEIGAYILRIFVQISDLK